MLENSEFPLITFILIFCSKKTSQPEGPTKDSTCQASTLTGRNSTSVQTRWKRRTLTRCTITHRKSCFCLQRLSANTNTIHAHFTTQPNEREHSLRPATQSISLRMSRFLFVRARNIGLSVELPCSYSWIDSTFIYSKCVRGIEPSGNLD